MATQSKTIDFDSDNGAGENLGRGYDLALIVDSDGTRKATRDDLDRVYSDAIMGDGTARVVMLTIATYGQDGAALAHDVQGRPWVRDSEGEWSEAECVPV